MTQHTIDDEALRRLYSTLREDAVDEVRRARVRRRVIQSLQSSQPARLAGRRSLIATLAAAAAGLGALAFGLWSHQGGGPGGPETRLDIQANGGIHLKWNDVGKARYRVLRSADPSSLSQKEGAVVRGTTYVDHDPPEAAVVYYRVE